jgi:hypothetical protein
MGPKELITVDRGGRNSVNLNHPRPSQRRAPMNTAVSVGHRVSILFANGI